MFLVLISVRGRINPRAYCTWKDQVNWKKFVDFIGSRTRDLPACSITPQLIAMPCASILAVVTKKITVSWVLACSSLSYCYQLFGETFYLHIHDLPCVFIWDTNMRAVYHYLKTKTLKIFQSKEYKMFADGIIGIHAKEIHKELNSVTWVRERTMPTERPPLVCKLSAKFCC
jgi:hypothetical protein